MAGAIEESRARLPQTVRGAPLTSRIMLGPHLVTKLVHDYALDHVVRPISSAYPIDFLDVPAMFDPLRRDELNERIADSDFVHLWNEYWRRVRIPKELGPPKGSFLDELFARFGFSFDRRGAAIGRRSRGLVRGNPVFEQDAKASADALCPKRCIRWADRSSSRAPVGDRLCGV